MANATIRSQWSTSSDHRIYEQRLTSGQCYNALHNLFQDGSSSDLAIATEASSHPSGIDSLLAQPWVYAGGGLGNTDECPMQVCLAGNSGRDSLIYASMCMVPECNALDLIAEDFSSRLETASFKGTKSTDSSIANEYLTIYHRIAQINGFLNAGWICGEYRFDWQVIPSTVYLGIVCLLIISTCIGTLSNRIKAKTRQGTGRKYYIPDDEENPEISYEMVSPNEMFSTRLTSSLSFIHMGHFFSAWDMSKNLKKLWMQRQETACLDGLKVGSILWVIAGHVMAIQSSSGPGYLNPSELLPPNGITTSLFGQLLFSSRFAVDTFLCISGYLVVHILQKKLCGQEKVKVAVSAMVLRILRILPLYAMCTGFWMFLAPHMGSGPFWYQWKPLLESCRQFWWTNALFVNNFIPWGLPTTETCFYHSWYLAVDVQLFFLFGPWLVFLFKKNPFSARIITVCLWCLSVTVTAVLAHERKWSINTFDGIAVSLFDTEGYSKPHIRAQSYLAGMLVAMMPQKRRPSYYDSLSMILALSGIGVVSLITVTGAYERRACNFKESPLFDDCGSLWSAKATFLYTAFSRALWSFCIAVLMYLCLQRRGRVIGSVLSWNIWTPLAQLSYGAYLIHPIVIFVWTLGGREKVSFGLFSFSMDVLSITVLSFVFSAISALMVEMPFSDLLRRESTENRDEHSSLISANTYKDILLKKKSYGSTDNDSVYNDDD